MKIAFADFSNWDYHALSVEEKPMGGTQSAVCYLSRAFAEAGHEASLIGAGSVPGNHGSVVSIARQSVTAQSLKAMQLDALICVLAAGRGKAMRAAIGNKPRLILWTGHDSDQPDVLPLLNPGEREAYDGFAMVSHWQRDRFRRAYSLDAGCTNVLRYAIAPAFTNLFSGDEKILGAKAQPPILAYTSTPFRGLELLLDCFPLIRQAVPDVRLEVFSSMGVYQMAGGDDQAQYGALYERCRQTAGVDYVGSLPQRELARRLRRVSVLAYPNTFAETSCIAVMEAMASGCHVVTSDLGALPETAAHFGTLIPAALDRPGYLQAFANGVIKALHEATAHPARVEAELARQVDQMNTGETWNDRAAQWTQWLQALPMIRPADSPPTVEQLLEGAMHSCRYGRFREAEPLLRQILARESHQADALHLMGLIAVQTQRLDEAISYFQQTLAVAPEFFHAHANLAQALSQAGRTDEAAVARLRAEQIRAGKSQI